MKQVRGFWLPDFEEHLVDMIMHSPEFAGGPTYQFHKFQLCFKYIKNFGLGVDIGGHCGLWSRVMAKCFTKVIAFEPVEEHAKCFHANVTDDNVTLLDYALGAGAIDSVRLTTGKNSSGDTFITTDGEHEATMRTLDSFDLPRVDFIKIDCEGYENFIIQGGANTIRKWRPVMIVEQKPGKGRSFGLRDLAGVELLQSWGARLVESYAGDYVMAW